MSDVQIAVIDQQDTQIVLAVPGVQGATGSSIPSGGTTDQVLRKNSSTDYDANWTQVTSAMIADGTIVNADVNASAAIAGTKISPDFGGQTVTTTGQVNAARVNVTVNTAPTNGIYLPASNTVGISTNGTGRLFVDASGRVGIGVLTPDVELHVEDATGNAVVQIESSTTGFSAVFFGDTTDGDVGTIRYDHSDNSMRFITDTAERLRITSAGLVGIGTSSVVRNLDISANSNPIIRLNNSTTAITNGSDIGGIEVYTNDASTNGAGIKSFIKTVAGLFGSAQGNTSLAFGVAAQGVGDASEVMRLTSTGLGIGTTSPIRLLHALDSANSIVGRVESGQSSSWLQFAASGTGTASRIGDPGGSANAGLAFMTADTERARIDSSGRLLVGTSTLRAVEPNGGSASGATLTTHFEGISSIPASVGLIHNGTTAAEGSALYLARTRGTAVASSTLVALGDTLGTIAFAGGDGTDIRTKAAEIYAVVDGTPGADDMPGRLVFSTTADGASSPTERMRITQSGAVLCGTTTTPTGAGGGSLVAQDRLVLAAEGAGRVQIRAGDTGTVTASTGTVVFRFKSNTASINLSAFVKITVSQRANSATASNSPAAEYCFQLHQNSSNAISINGATTTFEYTYVRGTHFAFADAGSNECTVTLTNPTGVSLAGSYKVEIMSHAGLWVLQSVSST